MIRTWTFQKRVTCGFAVMVGLAALTALIAVYALRTVVANKDRLVDVNAVNLTRASKLQAASNRQAAAFYGFLLMKEDWYFEQRRDATDSALETLRQLDQTAYTAEGRRLLGNVRLALAEYTAAQERIIALREARNDQDVLTRAARDQAQPKRLRVAETIDEFIAHEQNLLEESKRDSTARAAMAVNLLVWLAVATVTFAAGIAVMLHRALSRQIGSAVQHVQSSSTELQTSANQQATGARETATALSEVTTTMSELVATSRQIAESAQQVAHIAEETAGAARDGEHTVSTTQSAIEGIQGQVNIIVGHMLDLGKKSQQIGTVVDIISELAEQTNILSINATIEAAGAGEQGKRFAVVADEIRKLADRVGTSGKEIRALVEEIRGAVNTTVLATEVGSKAVDAGLHHFEEVTRGFRQIAGLVITTTQAAREIEISTKQQTSAVEQVSSAIGEAAQASRETEASSTQTLQTAVQLIHLSRDLSLIVQASA